MGKLVFNDNIALFEYPECAEPEFELKGDGRLFIFGYTVDFAGTNIGCAQSFNLPLKGFRVVGRYDKADNVIQGDEWRNLIFDNNINVDNCLVLFKDESNP